MRRTGVHRDERCMVLAAKDILVDICLRRQLPCYIKKSRAMNVGIFLIVVNLPVCCRPPGDGQPAASGAQGRPLHAAAIPEGPQVES